ncbi:MAG: beta-phosphoglucomutase [Crocinitomicaceae bacterium]|nr:beta-phosphoglucomutase [Crocinitomicaceae bacterium]
MRKAKALIFDLDGVVVTTEHNHFVAWKRTADRLGINFSERENEALKGLSRVDSLRKILEIGNKQIEENYFEELLVEKNNFYKASIAQLDRSACLPGVLNLLSKAKEEGIPMAVGSSSKNAKFILDRLNLSDYFQIIVDGNMVEHPKPHPEVFLQAAEAMKVVPSESIVFEDAESGIKAAKAGGFYAIAVGNPNIAALADEFLESLEEFKI